MHGADVARALGLPARAAAARRRRVLRLGMLQSDVRQDYLQVFLADLDKVERSARSTQASPQLETRARDALAATDSAPTRLRSSARSTCATTASNGRCASRSATGFDAGAARAAFEAEHQRLFGHIQPGGRIDITALRVVGRGRLDWTPPAARSPQADAAQAARDRARSGSIRPHGWRDVPVYDGADLRPGCTLDGPLLIEERTTTAFVGPRDALEVDAARRFPGS